jgi:hypothetical protein
LATWHEGNKTVSENVIELNGKRYDAITGAFLGKSNATPVPVAPVRHAPGKGKVIDGFVRRQGNNTPLPKQAALTVHASKITPAPKPKAASKPAVAKPAKATKPAPTAKLHHAGHAHAEARKAGTSVFAHQPQHAKTLMRSAVHKPQFEMKKAIKPQTPAEILAKPASALARKRSVAQVDPGRLERAKQVPKHASVRRFLPVGARSGLVEPTHHIATTAVPVIAVKPAPAARQAGPRAAAHAARPDMFEAAIARARSHEQAPVHRRRTHRRLINVMAGVAAFLIIGSFVAYLNLPNIELHVASVQAGFQATMPGYKPLGYTLRGGVRQEGGTVSMRFSSGDSTYIVTQQSSDWDSQSLLDNMLALGGGHQTVQKDGRTIYIYNGGSSAAWVTGDIRYDITGSASLSADDIVHIATSM